MMSKSAARSTAAARLNSSHSSHGQSEASAWYPSRNVAWSAPGASDEPVAKSVTSCPRATSPRASRSVTVSIDPDRGGGTG